MPIARETISAFAIGTSPSPAKRSASAGATSQASAAIGSAAAAQTAKIRRSAAAESRPRAAASERAVAVSGYETLIYALLPGRFQCSTLGGGYSQRLGRRPESNSADMMIPTPTRVGGAPQEGAVRSAREPDPTPNARYWFELLIAVLAIAGMLELGRTRSPGAPTTTHMDRHTSVAVLLLLLLARRRFPFAPRPPMAPGRGDFVRRRNAAPVDRAAWASSGWQARPPRESAER